MTKKALRKEFNPEFSDNEESFFTEYEKHLEKKIIEMERENFKRFMRLQEEEMNRYKWLKSEQAGKDLGSTCCDEWIEKYAKSFSDKYWDKK